MQKKGRGCKYRLRQAPGFPKLPKFLPQDHHMELPLVAQNPLSRINGGRSCVNNPFVFHRQYSTSWLCKQQDSFPVPDSIWTPILLLIFFCKIIHPPYIFACSISKFMQKRQKCKKKNSNSKKGRKYYFKKSMQKRVGGVRRLTFVYNIESRSSSGPAWSTAACASSTCSSGSP